MTENKSITDEQKQIAKEIIDTILDNAERLNFAWHFGEESMLASDVVNLINNVAGMDYKRCGSGFMNYDEKEPRIIDERCYMCENHFSRFPKSEHRQHCIGQEQRCNKFHNKWYSERE